MQGFLILSMVSVPAYAMGWTVHCMAWHGMAWRAMMHVTSVKTQESKCRRPYQQVETKPG